MPLPNSICELSTPSLIQKKTELFSVQKNPNKPISVTITELKIYVGICHYASVIHVPKVRDYWSTHHGFSPIHNALSLKRFEAIRAALHFNNNENMLPKTDLNFDRLFKLRSLVNYLNNQFNKILYSRDLSLDEQMCLLKQGIIENSTCTTNHTNGDTNCLCYVTLKVFHTTKKFILGKRMILDFAKLMTLILVLVEMW